MMRRLLNLFVLTQPEQRLIVILILVLVGAALFKHHRDTQNTLKPLQSGDTTVSDESRR